MVYLATEIETGELKIVKVFTPLENVAFHKEATNHLLLRNHPYLVKAEKVVNGYARMSPLFARGVSVPFFSYIVTPYSKHGSLIDFVMSA